MTNYPYSYSNKDNTLFEVDYISLEYYCYLKVFKNCYGQIIN